ncbi:MBL fold hydrolase [Aliidongia dinghuensis]|uniref:MBL fold hydrolase n=1 Tax=Aliidongia dinghuensis TaxID=1867774 RepID=A0A8J2YYW6_9PROT|nr:MBL fold hydrolase [Aliidongia dinghuensis]
MAAAARATLNKPDELVFLPLGGAGEIGMNLNLYGYGGKWLIVDLGISFPDETQPGIEVIMADPSFAAERKDELAGLIITHAHEDHIGAVAHLWPRLECPIYATPFTASVLRLKLAEAGLLHAVDIIEQPLGSRFPIGPFDIELISLTHSIPEPNALVIRTGAGTVLHTGDWKFDPNPLVGQTSDFAALTRLGEEGVDALVGDSTNALRAGEAGSEADVRESLIELVGRYDNRIAITCFASNVARLQSAAAAGAAHGRQVALVGRSLWRMEQAARENGYLDGTPPFITPEAAAELPRDEVLLICTGSQGEARSALARIAANDHQNITLEAGDTVIFSSRVIPGNERPIGRLQNQLAKRGVTVVTDDEHFVHVSGHPARDELSRMYQLVRPKVALPVHGEARHLIAHAQLAEECQVPQSVVIENGEMVRLAPGPAKVIDQVDTGRLGLDGKSLVALEGGAFKTRLRMTFNGSAVATVVLDRRGKLLALPQITVHGLIGEDAEDTMGLTRAIERAVNGLPAGSKTDDEAVREAARLAIRRSLNNSIGKKPVTEVHVVRV